jgi:hypothetical protein
MATTITAPTRHVHLDARSIADRINASVVANGKAVVVAAKPVHLSPSEIAAQITAATGQPALVQHLDSASLCKAIDASIALM